MQAVNFLLVDELLQGQDEGFSAIDYSHPEDSPDRQFYLHCVLLFLVGDYPGMGKMTNMVHSGYSACHWCNHRFGHHSAGHNVALDNRRHLPRSHRLRVDPRFGAPCLFDNAPPPLRRTHSATASAAREVEQLEGTDRDKMVKDTGVRGVCMFSSLRLFDICGDCLPDMMHILKDLWQHYFIPYFKGEVKPAIPKLPRTTFTRKGTIYNYDAEELQRRKEKHQAAMEVYNNTLKVTFLLFLAYRYCNIIAILWTHNHFMHYLYCMIFVYCNNTYSLLHDFFLTFLCALLFLMLSSGAFGLAAVRGGHAAGR